MSSVLTFDVMAVMSAGRSLLFTSVAAAALLAGCGTAADRMVGGLDGGGGAAPSDAMPQNSLDSGATDDASAAGDSGEVRDASAEGSRDGSADAADAPLDGARDAASDVAILDSGDDGAPLDGGACTALPNTAPIISAMNVATARPAGTGGTVVDGVYFKTKHSKYTGIGGAAGPAGFTVRETLSVANAASGAASLQSIQSFVAMPDVTERLTLQPLGGGTIALTFICPDYGRISPDPEYSVRVGATTELDISVGLDTIETFTKQ